MVGTKRFINCVGRSSHSLSVQNSTVFGTFSGCCTQFLYELPDKKSNNSYMQFNQNLHILSNYQKSQLKVKVFRIDYILQSWANVGQCITIVTLTYFAKPCRQDMFVGL